MSRKHYKAFAAMMAERRPNAEIYPHSGQTSRRYQLWFAIVCDMAHIFRSDNAAFDKQRFIDACMG